MDLEIYKEISKIKKIYIDLNVLSSGIDESDKFHEQSKLILEWAKEKNITLVVPEILLEEIDDIPLKLNWIKEKILKLLEGFKTEKPDVYERMVATEIVAAILPIFKEEEIFNDICHFTFAIVKNCDAFVSWNKDIVELKVYSIQQIASKFGIRKIPTIYEPGELSDKIKQVP